MKNKKLKSLFYKFWPIFFIFSIWFIFAYPYFLNNKVPFPSTYQVNNFSPWSSYEKFWGPVKNGAMPDIITQIYPWRHLAIEVWKSGQVPLWNSFSFSGTPLLANYQSAVLSPFNILFFILPFIDAWSILVLIQPLMAGIFMYLLIRSLNRSRVAGMIASISFMFCGFITVWMGYSTLSFAILFLPLAIYSIEKYFKEKKSKFLLLLAFTIPLSFFSGHFQASLYFLLTVFAYLFYKVFSARSLSKGVFVFFSIAGGFLMSMPQILPSIEFYTQSFRSGAFEKGEVIPWGYVATFLSPDFFGNPVTRNDWFGHYAEWNAYIGIFPLMLAIYSVIRKRNFQTLFLLISSVIVIFLAFPTPLQDLFVNLHIPVLSTSAASRIIVIYSFFFGILAAIGYDYLNQDIKNKKTVKIIIWLAIFLLIFLILWLIVGLRLFIPQDKIEIAKNNLVLPTIIFGTSLMLVLISLWNKKLLLITSFLLIGIVAFDMLRFSTKWMPFDPKTLAFPDTSTTLAFPKIEGYHRVIANFGGESSVYYKLPSMEGYDPLYIKKYGEFISFLEDGKARNLSRSVVSFPRMGLYTSQAINLLDIKYVAHKISDNNTSWTFPFWSYPKEHFSLIYKDNKYEFYENNHVFPHVFLVGKYRIIKDQKKIVDTMFSDDFDLQKEIILEEDPKIIPTDNFMGSAEVLSYRQNSIDISVEASNPSLLFLSENYYQGWRAIVDGKNVPILKANYAFRAIPVDKGRHSVRFFYDPLSFRIGLYMALAGLIGSLFIFYFSKSEVR